jgi:hypothetical protein
MSVATIAQAYLDGYYPATHGLALHDAVHVLATQYGVHKADLKSAIVSATVSESPAEEPVESPEAIDGSTCAVAEGADADDLPEETRMFLQNYP